MSVDKKLLYNLAEQEVSSKEMDVITTSNVEIWSAAQKIRAGKKQIPNEVVFYTYYLWCRQTNETPLNYATFFKHLNKIVPGKYSRRYLDPSSFDTSSEFFFKARQKLQQELPNHKGAPRGRRRVKIDESKTETKESK